MHRLTSLLVLLALALSIAGCASSGRDFDTAGVKSIEKGKTTEAELIHTFGEPNRRITMGTGGTILMWTFNETNSFKHLFDFSMGNRSTTTSKVFNATIDASGIVQDYTLSEGSTVNQTYR